MDEVDIHGPAFLADPGAAFARLREECPVARSERHGGFWLLTRYEDVRAAAINWRDFTSAVSGVTAIPVITPRTAPQLPIELDPPRHSRYRALVNPVFSAERVAQITPRIEALVRERLRAIAAAGEGEMVAAFCVPVAVASLAAFTDLPLADSGRWVGWITRMFDVSDREGGARASAELGAYVDELIARRRAEPTGDFVSMLIAAEIEGETLDDDAIRSFMTVVFGAGFETTADALSVMLGWLADHPAELARLRAEPALVPLAVEEFLRVSSPIQLFGRNASHDLCLHGREIREGDVVALAFGSANRDPDTFDAPDEVRLDRRPNRHLAFGAGPHLCAGAGVARMEMALTLEALGALGVTLERAGVPARKTRGDRHGFASLPLRVEREESPAR